MTNGGRKIQVYIRTFYYVFMHISYFIGVLNFIAYLYMFIGYAYVKGEFLGNLSLMDAYI